jgi:RNA polymerase sigma-70 factor (ECF subfamily)
LKVHQKLDTIQEPKALKAWLYRTTQHTIIDRYRKEYGSKEWVMDELFWESTAWDIASSNQEKLVRNISSCILPMINDLDDTSKAVMERYTNPEYTLQQIAHELWLSLSNVKVIIHRSKKKLKAMYDQCCYQYKDHQWTIIDTWCSKNCGCEGSVLQ